MMLVNMWDAFCSLAFACGGFYNLLLSGGRCVRGCMRGVASVHAACAQVDRIKGTVPCFPCGFILCIGGLISDGLPLEYCWPGARSNLCDLLVFLPSSILRIVSPELCKASARCVLNTD